ncbi:MAG: HIT domain-containing protein [Mycobacteriales bacterium]
MDDCLFCKIVAGAVPADKVREDGLTVAFRDIDPQAPVHVLVVPRAHHPTPGALAAAAPDALVAMLAAATGIAAAEGVSGTGYRCVFNVGRDAHQSVEHAHLHVLGGRDLRWPPG